MQNNLVHSSLLKSYIAGVKSEHQPQLSAVATYNTPVPDLNPPANLERQPEQDVVTKEVDEQKQKTAEIALLSALGLGTIMALGLAFGGKSLNKEKLSRLKNDIPDIKIFDNITNIKDTVVRRLTKICPAYKKFDDFTSGITKSLITKTIDGKYKKTFDAFKGADEAFAKFIQKNKTAVETGDSKRLEELWRKLMSEVTDFTSKDSTHRRLNELDKNMQNMDESAWKKLKETIDTIFKKREIKKGAKSLLTESVAGKRVEEAFEFQKTLTENFKHMGLSESEFDELTSLIKKMSKEGDTAFVQQFKKATGLYNSAFEKETLDLVKKYRDINCGSAPTDIEGILGTLGLFGIYTAQADSKEEKVGVTLTTGVPLMATLGTTLFATCKMISGAKALGLGLVTGAITKSICEALNKKYQESHNNSETPKTIITFDDYIEKIKDIKNGY